MKNETSAGLTGVWFHDNQASEAWSDFAFVSIVSAIPNNNDANFAFPLSRPIKRLSIHSHMEYSKYRLIEG